MTAYRETVSFCWQVQHCGKILSLLGLTCLTETRSPQHHQGQTTPANFQENTWKWAEFQISRIFALADV